MGQTLSRLHDHESDHSGDSDLRRPYLRQYAALAIGRRGTTHQQTFGYKRVEILATLVSLGLLYVTGFYIAIEAWHRFRAPQPIAWQLVIWIALLGFAEQMSFRSFGGAKNLKLHVLYCWITFFFWPFF
jgi:hypothetical protein